MSSLINSFRAYNSKLRLSKKKNIFLTPKEKTLKTISNFSILTHNWENKCPGGKNCKNYDTIMQLKYEIKRLTQTIEQLNKIIDYFSFNMVQKEIMYKEMLKENAKIQNNIKNNSIRGEKQRSDYDNNNHKRNSIRYKIFSINDINEEIFSSDNYSETELEEEEERKRKEEEKEKELLKYKLDKKPLKSFKRMKTVNIEHHPKTDFDIENNSKNDNSKNIPSILNGGRKQIRNKTKRVQIQYDSDNKITKFFSSLENEREKERRKKEEEERRKKEEEERRKKEEKDRRKKEEEKNKNKNKKKFIKNPYFEISSLSQRTQKHNLQNSTGISFLALSNEYLKEMTKNKNINKLYTLTLNDDLFINELQTSDKETMNNYCDIIGALVKDYICLINLIQRIKSFLEGTQALISCVEEGDSVHTLIKNTCKILNCDRASLFIHDRMTDMLVVHSAEGLKKNQIKVPKNKGVVGFVFMNKEKLKIDNAYQDSRFNKDVDRKTGYKTRNIMCYPLIDNDGDVFGAIQAINKLGNKDSSFNNDDEELLSIFSQQASAILKNEINKNQHYIQINKLKNINSYSVQIHNIHNLKDFVNDTEKIICSMFDLSDVQILFNLNGFLYDFKKDKFLGYNNLGIVYYVYNKKICHGCIKASSCKYYNNLVDMKANDSMVTYPVLDNNNNVLCVFQISCNIPISEVGEKPKENEMMILKMFDEIICDWILNHQSAINGMIEKNQSLIQQYSIRNHKRMNS